jgi:hypothetical protein
MSREDNALDPVLDALIKETIHSTLLEGIIGQGKIIHELATEELDYLFEMVAFNVKEQLADHFKGLPPSIIRGRFEAIQEGIENAKRRLINELGLGSGDK